MALARDSRLGKYVIREQIGVGGMGAVYRAYDLVLKRQVAIKTILADRIADRDIVARFRLEAEAISKIDYPHIVKLMEFSEGNSKKGEPPYMVMELLEGQSLQSLIRKGPLPVVRTANILLETCAAVSVCHRRGIVHRDLKGTNIFIAEYDGAEVVKVLDFGIAKVWATSASADQTDKAEVTRKGVAIGTPEYFAPELLRGAPASPATDQYALGVVLYSALTGGRRPFEVSKNAEHRDLQLLQAILNGDHLTIRAHRPALPEALEAVVERAITHEAELRFKSVHELGEALLPWAAPDVQARWTKHFTTAPRPIKVHESMVIAPEIVVTAREGQGVDVVRSSPRASSSTTRQVASGEIRDLLEAGMDMTKRRPADRPSSATEVTMKDPSPRSISIDIERSIDAAIPVERSEERPETIALAPQRSRPAPVATGPQEQRRAPAQVHGEKSSPRRRWLYLLLAAAAASAVALVFFARGADPSTPAARQEPAVSAAAPAAAPAPPATPGPSTRTAPPALSEAAASVPSSAATAAADKTATPAVGGAPADEEARRTKSKRRHRKPKVDENGIGIPTE